MSLLFIKLMDSLCIIISLMYGESRQFIDILMKRSLEFLLLQFSHSLHQAAMAALEVHCKVLRQFYTLRLVLLEI